MSPRLRLLQDIQHLLPKGGTDLPFGPAGKVKSSPKTEFIPTGLRQGGLGPELTTYREA
jgi:hypothetical protein